jgi:hypothetical protein
MKMEINEMTSIKATLALCAILTIAMVSKTQPLSDAPRPTPQHQRLGYFVGKWHSEGEVKPGAFGPGGKYTETEDSQWMPGGFFVAIHLDQETPMGNGKTLMILGYDAGRKVYTFNAFNSFGQAETAIGTLDGDTWTWLSELNIGGRPVKTRFAMKEISPAAYSTRFETSPDGGAWTTILEGKTVKTE